MSRELWVETRNSSQEIRKNPVETQRKQVKSDDGSRMLRCLLTEFAPRLFRSRNPVMLSEMSLIVRDQTHAVEEPLAQFLTPSQRY